MGKSFSRNDRKGIRKVKVRDFFFVWVTEAKWKKENTLMVEKNLCGTTLMTSICLGIFTFVKGISMTARCLKKATESAGECLTTHGNSIKIRKKNNLSFNFSSSEKKVVYCFYLKII